MSAATAKNLVGLHKNKCVWCYTSQSGEICSKANKMTLKETRNILSEKNGCFRCVTIGNTKYYLTVYGQILHVF